MKKKWNFSSVLIAFQRRLQPNNFLQTVKTSIFLQFAKLLIIFSSEVKWIVGNFEVYRGLKVSRCVPGSNLGAFWGDFLYLCISEKMILIWSIGNWENAVRAECELHVIASGQISRTVLLAQNIGTRREMPCGPIPRTKRKRASWAHTQKTKKENERAQDNDHNHQFNAQHY